MALHNSTCCAVPILWLLLDSQLTVDLIANPKMLTDLQMVKDKYAICVYCNKGVKVVNQIGNLPG